jgi:hypothetical protein
MPDTHEVPDDAAAVRHERFSTLPPRILPEEMVEEQAATAPDPAKETYNPDDWLVRYSL